MTKAEIRLEISSGASEQGGLSFYASEPIEPFTVGQQGALRISAPGLASVHAYIFFDGTTLFITSLSGVSPVIMQDEQVPCAWTPIVPPCEIRMGTACLLVTQPAPRDMAASRPGFVPPGVSPVTIRRDSPHTGELPRDPNMDFDDSVEAPTVDASQEDLLKPRPKRPKIRFGPVGDDSTATRIDPKSVQRTKSTKRKPKIVVPIADEATRFAPMTGESPGSAPSRQSTHSYEDTPPPHRYTPPLVDRVQSQVKTDPALYRQNFDLPPASPDPAPAAYAPTLQTPQVPSVELASGILQWPPATSTAGVLPSAGAQPFAARAIKAWKESSVPQKAILIMLPFAFAAVFVVFSEDSERTAAGRLAPSASGSTTASASSTPAESASAARSSETPVGSAPASSDLPPAVASAPTQPPVPPPISGPRGKGVPRTLERAAADAVAAGAWQDAIHYYEQLQAQHPDMPVYREAVRILKSKAAETR